MGYHFYPDLMQGLHNRFLAPAQLFNANRWRALSYRGGQTLDSDTLQDPVYSHKYQTNQLTIVHDHFVFVAHPSCSCG